MLKWSFWYDVIRVYVRFVHRLFYRRIQVYGLENIPKDKPIIFAPNHQNALMDPLYIIFTNSLQTVFLTRADIFKRPLLLKIFTFLKMLPVYRLRDGIENLANNDVVFKKSVDVLLHNQSLALFPEAAHNNKFNLLPLKKAVPRIAFQAAEESHFEADILIIPVGIFYDEYTSTNSYLAVNYGKPIRINEYKDSYLVDNHRCLNEFRKQLTVDLKKQMVHVEEMENYDLILFITKMCWSQNEKYSAEKFRFFKEKIEVLNSWFKENPEKIQQFQILYDKFKMIAKNEFHEDSLKEQAEKRFAISTLLLVITFPLFLYGLLNNIIYYFLLKIFIKRFKDSQFHSSVKFVFAAIIMPVFYILHFLIFYFISFNFQLSFLYFISLPISAWIANKYKYFIFEWFKQLKWILLPQNIRKSILLIRKDLLHLEINLKSEI